MKVFDLHCDTVSTCMAANRELYENEGQLDVKRGISFDRWVQTFAFWLDDIYRGEEAWTQFEAQYAFWLRQTAKHPEAYEFYQGGEATRKRCCNMLLSVEGGAVLGGRLDRVQTLSDKGISFLTLTWNGANELASGALSEGGLTVFGEEVLAELERCDIIADVSHLNEQSFYDVAARARRPLIATHSNAKAVYSHPRNLSDEQIRYLIDHHGLIGLNFYPPFVNGQDDCSLDDLCRHAEHILSLGGEHVLALGSDFDGASMPSAIREIKGLEKLYESMLKYFHEEQTDRIFYDNAARFADEWFGLNP